MSAGMGQSEAHRHAGEHPEQPIRVGVSACLLGEKVRFDGGHKHARFLTGMLGPYVEFVAMCPEVEIGLGVPRDSLRLLRGEDGAMRLMTPATEHDHTDAMNAWARERVARMAGEDLCGFILRKDSPSCGMERVKIYDWNGVPGRTGVGLFAAELLRQHPWLPVEEEGRLNDPLLRENFVECVFAYRRVKDRLAPGWTLGDLVEFHTREKLLQHTHDEVRYRELGRLVAGSKALERDVLAERYTELFMQAMKTHTTVKRHVNVLQHIMGHFKGIDDPLGRRELEEAIEDYRNGLVPLIAPITLIRPFVRRYEVEYLASQTYLNPHPKELMLRNHV